MKTIKLINNNVKQDFYTIINTPIDKLSVDGNCLNVKESDEVTISYPYNNGEDLEKDLQVIKNVKKLLTV